MRLWVIDLDPDQEYLGKSFITLRRHAERLSDLTDQEFFELVQIVRMFETASVKAWAPSHFNWACLMNDAKRDHVRCHVHIHAIPRYDVTKTVYGREFIDRRYPMSARTVFPNRPSSATLRQIMNDLTVQGLECDQHREGLAA